MTLKIQLGLIAALALTSLSSMAVASEGIEIKCSSNQGEELIIRSTDLFKFDKTSGTAVYIGKETSVTMGCEINNPSNRYGVADANLQNLSIKCGNYLDLRNAPVATGYRDNSKPGHPLVVSFGHLPHWRSEPFIDAEFICKM